MTSLVKKIDEANDAHKKDKMGSFVIFLEKSDEFEKKVKELGEKSKLKHTVLALDNPAGPKGYDIAKEADVTVLLYVGRKVKFNYAFEKGKMTAADVEKITKDVSKLFE